jgi:multiple sugar transport system substrate-binding protein
MRIDRRVPIPLYFQLKQFLEEQIATGALRPGEQLPTEEELRDRYGLSRTPVRQALSELVHDGLVVRTPGRGTFVTAPPEAGDGGHEPVLRVVISDGRWRQPLSRAAGLWSRRRGRRVRLDIETVPLDQLHEHLVRAVGRGEAPDISVLDSVWLAEFAGRHFLHAVDEVDPDWARWAESAFFPPLLHAGRWDEHLYGIPIEVDVSGLWYRRDWLEAEGLEPPAGWDELVAVGRHFRERRVRARYGLGPAPLAFVGGESGGETTTYQLLPLLWSAGGDLVGGGAVRLAQPETVRALAFLRALVVEHGIAGAAVTRSRWDGAMDAFAHERVAMALGGSYEGFLMRREAGWTTAELDRRAGFVPVPGPAGGRPATLVGAMSYVTYRQSRHPELAVGLLAETARPEVLLPFCRRTAQAPPLVDTARMVRPSDGPLAAAVVEMLPGARPRPALPEYDRVSRELALLVERCITSDRPVAELATVAAERVAAITGLPRVPEAGGDTPAVAGY